LHWESWLLRAVLLLAVGFQLAAGDRSGALVAAEGFVLSLAPVLVQRFSRIHVLRAVELAFVLAIALQFVSESFKLYEHFYYWDKLAHPAEIFLATFVGALLLLGYLDTYRIALPRPFAAVVSMLAGASLGAFWEFIEFGSDWFGSTNLQKSNADTMTDLLTNDVAAVGATLVVFWLYHHRTTARQRERLGHVARWLTDGLGGLLHRHGVVLALVLALLVAGLLGAGWFVDRSPPAPSLGGAPGGAQTWSFTPDDGGDDAGGAGSAGATAPLLGSWQAGARGVCKASVEPRRPGSEQAGLLALAPGAVYGRAGDGFSVVARVFEERPAFGAGSQMTAGIAFGIRGPQDFYLLELSALHDVVRLDRFVHGRRRDIREERVRTRGDQWHDLELRVQGDDDGALVDGRQVFEQRRVGDAAGGLGLWARVSATACFSLARAAPLPPGG
jgi:hypothetical protein